VFCRAEIRRLKEIEKKLNDVNCELHCVLKESIEAEVMEFSRDFWKSEEKVAFGRDEGVFSRRRRRRFEKVELVSNFNQSSEDV
jgi:hypothetical protein